MNNEKRTVVIEGFAPRGESTVSQRVFSIAFDTLASNTGGGICGRNMTHIMRVEYVGGL